EQVVRYGLAKADQAPFVEYVEEIGKALRDRHRILWERQFREIGPDLRQFGVKIVDAILLTPKDNSEFHAPARRYYLCRTFMPTTPASLPAPSHTLAKE